MFSKNPLDGGESLKSQKDCLLMAELMVSEKGREPGRLGLPALGAWKQLSQTLRQRGPSQAHPLVGEHLGESSVLGKHLLLKKKKKNCQFSECF